MWRRTRVSERRKKPKMPNRERTATYTRTWNSLKNNHPQWRYLSKGNLPRKSNLARRR
jgi:hypothetical protein